jgi:hypothetical protein
LGQRLPRPEETLLGKLVPEITTGDMSKESPQPVLVPLDEG